MLKAIQELNSFSVYTYCIRQATIPSVQFNKKYKVLCLNRGKIKLAVKQINWFFFPFNHHIERFGTIKAV